MLYWTVDPRRRGLNLEACLAARPRMVSAADRRHAGMARPLPSPCCGQVSTRRGSGLCCQTPDRPKLFLTDGRIEIDNNTVERTTRPIAINRKDAPFSGQDVGAESGATIASLVETCKLNAVDPQDYSTPRSRPPSTAINKAGWRSCCGGIIWLYRANFTGARGRPGKR